MLDISGPELLVVFKEVLICLRYVDMHILNQRTICVNITSFIVIIYSQIINSHIKTQSQDIVSRLKTDEFTEI